VLENPHIVNEKNQESVFYIYKDGESYLLLKKTPNSPFGVSALIYKLALGKEKPSQYNLK